MPLLLPRFLPDDWKGGFVMLVIVFVLSSFLDNIAAAMIGGTMASALYRGRVHVGFLAAIVAASNAGGSGSVVGDTTTTMMWIDGVSRSRCSRPTSRPSRRCSSSASSRRASSTRTSRSRRTPRRGAGRPRPAPGRGRRSSSRRSSPTSSPASDHGAARPLPAIGLAVWLALLLAAPPRRPTGACCRRRSRGGVFLISLVLSASMMPVEALPAASWPVALGLGFVSAVFDNIPLTALALQPGRLRLGLSRLCGRLRRIDDLVRLVGRRRAGEPVPATRARRSVGHGGWHVTVAYVLGFFVLLLVLGWHRIRALVPSRPIVLESSARLFASRHGLA